MKFLFCLSILFLFAACASTREARDPYASEPTTKKIATISRATSSAESAAIDEVALQRSLGLESDNEDLGFREKSFNTCQVGYGYSSSHDCEKKHFVVIHYRLQCRDSEGTTSTIMTDENVRPIADREVKWALNSQKGISQTDGSGYGQIRGIFPSSQKGQRLKLATNGEFLYIRAGEINKIVTPKSWCPF